MKICDVAPDGNQDPGVETKLALRKRADLLAQRCSKPWDAVRRQPHHDVFVMIRSESQIGRDRCIELPQRMGRATRVSTRICSRSARASMVVWASDAPSTTMTAARSNGETSIALAAWQR